MLIVIAALGVLLIAGGFIYWYKMHPRDAATGLDRSDASGAISIWINRRRSLRRYPVLDLAGAARLFPDYLHYPGGYAATGMSWEEGIEITPDSRRSPLATCA
jgi:hypothetical protein